MSLNQPATTAATNHLPAEEAIPQTSRILLIDDSEDDYRITALMLQSAGGQGHDLRWLCDIQQALEAMVAGEFDVCLLDYNLGRQNGLSLLQQAIRAGCKRPVILLTGLADPAIDWQAMHIGARDYLLKEEMNPALLDRAIRYVLSQDRLLQRLQQSEQQKELYMATLTHDLKSPVAGEALSLALLLGNRLGPLTPAQRKTLEAMQQSNRFLQQMVSNIVASYQYQQTGVPLTLEAVCLQQLLKNAVIPALASTLQTGGHRLLLQFCQHNHQLFADAMALQRLLYNLIHNAASCMQSPGCITITTQTSPTELSISVADTGPGIPAAQQAELFLPYKSSRNRSGYVGTGLGLYLCQKIVEAHQGTIAYSTKPQQGTTFTVRLPRNLSAAQGESI
ncbi:MAG: ATP-binding protein [Candidatus Melainabacteria bacterium]|nr:ATP-binding protein [Candidatus Melainabacteria bacterium]